MNKVIAVNLNGAAYQVEEAGYEALRAYLDSASHRLATNPDRVEIIADIEQAVADKFRTLLTAHKNVITTGEVERIITEMGPVEDGSSAAEAETGRPATAAAATPQAESSHGAKRFFRLPEGAMIAGLCNGAAAYFKVDPTVVRVAVALVVLLSLLTYPWEIVLFWTAAYTILALIVPRATTAAEQSAAHGGPDVPRTAQEFIRRARAGYYEGMKTWHDRAGRREWKRKFRQDMRGWKHRFKREMRRQGEPFGERWQRPWSGSPLSAVAWVVLPIVALLQVALIWVWLLAVLSVISTGAAFGHPLPAAMPLWKALIVLAAGYLILSLPLRMTRRAVIVHSYHGFYYNGPGAGLARACRALVWVGSLGLLLWLLLDHPTELGRVAGELAAAVLKAGRAVVGWLSAVV